MSVEPRWICESDVVEVLTIRTATTAVAQALVHEHHGGADTLAKTALTWGGAHTLHALGGVVDASGAAGVAGTKTWAHTAGGATPLLVLWDAATGSLLAVVEAFALGQLRTASVSAVATGHLARRDARTMAMIGTGKQALAQVAAVASVRPLDEVRVFSPSPEHRDAFAARLRDHGAARAVVVSSSVGEAVAGADVVTTATRATQPFLHAADLVSDAHVNALGAITPDRRELAADVPAAASLVVSDSPVAAATLSSELDDREAISLSAVVGDRSARVRPGGLTVFKAMGLGLADVALGIEVLRRAHERGLGRPLPHPERAAPHLFAPADRPAPDLDAQGGPDAEATA